jgi:hypothetical protein
VGRQHRSVLSRLMWKLPPVPLALARANAGARVRVKHDSIEAEFRSGTHEWPNV